MAFMDFVNCSKYQSIKHCCSEKSSISDENENNERHNKYHTFPEGRDKVGAAHSAINVVPLRFIKNKRNDEYSEATLSQTTNMISSLYQPSEYCYGTREQASSVNTQKEFLSFLNGRKDEDCRCPRCGKRMQEPKLLPCLHPICSPCVSELMNRSDHDYLQDARQQSIRSKNSCTVYYEICPLCDFQLPNANSTIPPPHYPLQHRLVMSAIHSRFANKVLCDNCADEVVAVVQCSTCLCNYCLDCGMEHQQVTLESKHTKHCIRPLWEATKVRRTELCQQHPTNALCFYCIACQQVTCKVCMWSSQHRGHASETVTGAGKRITVHLTKILQRARMLLNVLLTQYNRNAFLNTTIEEIGDASISMDYRYNKYIPVWYKKYNTSYAISLQF